MVLLVNNYGFIGKAKAFRYKWIPASAGMTEHKLFTNGSNKLSTKLFYLARETANNGEVIEIAMVWKKKREER